VSTTVPRGESAATARLWQIATRFLAPPTQGRPPDGRLQKEDTTMRHSTVGKLVTGAALLAVVVGLRVTAAPPEAQALSRPIADMNGRVLRADPSTGVQDVYGTIPTNTDTSFTDMPGFVVFDTAGNLYVSDWSAPIIWRVPPGGGQAQLWFTDPRLAGTYGANVAGIALDPSGQNLYKIGRAHV